MLQQDLGLINDYDSGDDFSHHAVHATGFKAAEMHWRSIPVDYITLYT